MTDPDIKRLFFGIEVHAPWPEDLPSARMVAPECRHITLAFLGNVIWLKLSEALATIVPTPNIPMGLVGQFDECLFLPPDHPNALCWNVHWLSNPEALERYQKELTDWLVDQKFLLEMPKRPWLCHVTLGRKPFHALSWQKAFRPCPMMATSLHLYESRGSLSYIPLWSYDIPPPFEELDHTADIAYGIYGKNVQEIFLHAAIALTFSFPSLLPFIDFTLVVDSLDSIIRELNYSIMRLDASLGSPCKAVSYHGELSTLQNGLLFWEMIIDV